MKTSKKIYRNRKAFMIIAVCLSAGFMTIMEAVRTTAEAQELGGFQVEIGTGENTDLPLDWEGSDSVHQENGTMMEPEYGVQEELWNEESEIQTEQPPEEVEDLIPDQDYSEIPVPPCCPPDEQVNTPEPIYQEEEFGSEQEGTIRTENISEEQGTVEENRQEQEEAVPSLEVPASPPAVISKVSDSSRKKYKEKRAEALQFKITEKMPRIICWSGDIKKEYLDIQSKDFFQIVSVRSEGRELSWKWKGHRLFPNIEKDNLNKNKTMYIQLILISYSDLGHGIFIDGKKESCYTIP